MANVFTVQFKVNCVKGKIRLKFANSFCPKKTRFFARAEQYVGARSITTETLTNTSIHPGPSVFVSTTDVASLPVRPAAILSRLGLAAPAPYLTVSRASALCCQTDLIDHVIAEN